MESNTFHQRFLPREIVITDPEGQNVPPVAFETFDDCPFPDEIKDEAGNRVSRMPYGQRLRLTHGKITMIDGTTHYFDWAMFNSKL